MENEQWKPVEGYEDYEVSNWGRVKSLNYRRTGREKVMSPGKDKDGYLQVHLWKNGVAKPFKIHRLVYEMFAGEIPDGLEVSHLDDNKENCRLENLEACSHKANCNWGNRNKKIAAALRGKKQPPEAVARSAAARRGKFNTKKSKPVEALNPITMKVVYVFPSTREAQRQGFNQGSVAACCRGERKIHKGLRWRFVQ